MWGKEFIAKYSVYLALILSIAATLGSLYYSEIRNFAPCTLCWYQRIFMYPLIIILTVGILRKDKKLYYYVLPMSIIGAFFALYHVLLQKGIIPQLAPCVTGISCKVSYIEYFGFITIPLMSFATFAIITVCMLLYKSYQKKQ